jgi:hypothetical protein
MKLRLLRFILRFVRTLLRLPSYSFSVFVRRITRQLFEESFKIPETTESDLVADLGNGIVGSLGEQFFRLLNPNHVHVFLIRYADDAMEKPAEMILAQASLSRNLCETEFFLIVLMDEFDGPLDAQMWQRGFLDKRGPAVIFSGTAHTTSFPLNLASTRKRFTESAQTNLMRLVFARTNLEISYFAKEIVRT